MRLAAAFESGRSAEAEMPDWSRRRFIGNSLTLGVTAVAAGAIGRTLLTLRDREAASVEMPPAPVETAPPLPVGARLDVAGITPLVVPNSDFYRIDTQLFTPRLNATDWRLTVTGMVDKPQTFTYAQLLAMPLYEEYITIQCVSNEVGGDLVGNALWRGARLRDMLDMAGIQPGATQIVGRSFDGWTAG
ncbi:MAG: oxidoreductase, partial [Chloroflexi bacterium]